MYYCENYNDDIHADMLCGNRCPYCGKDVQFLYPATDDLVIGKIEIL